MQVRQAQLPQLAHQVAELRLRVRHPHPLEPGVGAQSDGRPLGPDGRHHRPADLEREPRALLHAAAPRVGALVGHVLNELVDQIAVRAVDLDAVEARRDGVPRRLRVILDEAADLIVGQRRRGREGGERDGARAHDLEPLGLEVRRDGDAAERPELQPDGAAGLVDGVGDGAPGGDLVAVPDAGDVGVARGAGRDEGALGDEEGAGDGGALRVVVRDEGEGDVGVVGAEAGERGEGDAVLEFGGADLQGLEEGGGGGRHCEGGCGESALGMEDGGRRRRHDESRRMERMEGKEMGYLGHPSTFISSLPRRRQTRHGGSHQA